MAPALSIVVSSYQRRHFLEPLLASIAAASSGQAPIEVVVSIDGSTDGSTELVEGLAPSFPVPLRPVWHENGGLSAARNRGIAAAAADLVWLLDDDMLVTAGALAAHLGWDRSRSPVLMGPCNLASVGADADAARGWYEPLYERLAAAGVVDRPADVAFANTSAPTALLRAHPFDEGFRGYGLEDIELGVRLQEAGVVPGFDAAAGVSHEYHASPAERLAKRREEGRNCMRFVELRPDRRDLVLGPPRRLERLLRPATDRGWSGLLWLGARGLAAVARRPVPAAGVRKLLADAEFLASLSGRADARR